MRIQRTQMKPILTSSLALATFVGQILTAATLPVDAKTHKLSATREEPRIQLARLPFTKSKEEKEAQEEKEKAEKKKEEEKKSEKTEKSDKKVEKTEKSEKKAEASKEEKPAKKGFFGGKKEEKKVEKTESVEKKETEKVVEEKSAPKKTEREKQEAPKFVPDAALISILKDISKALPQAGEAQGIANADERTIVELAQQVLDKAISAENLPNDRILAKGTDGKSSMQTEAWASGEVKVSDKLMEGILGPIKNKAVQLPGGRIISPCSVEGSDIGWKVYFELSDDGGATWRATGLVDQGPEVRAIQPSILLHPGGRLQAIGRTRSKRLFSCWSGDSGESWGDFSLLDVPNCNSGTDALTLQDGRHLLVYNHSEVEKVRYPLNVAVSEDGVRWHPGPVLEAEPPGQYSYPAVIQTSGGEVHIAYTWKRLRMKHAVLRLG